MDLLKFPGAPESGGVRMCSVGLILENRDGSRGIHDPSPGISLEAEGTSHPPGPCSWLSVPISHLETPAGAVGSPRADPGVLGVQELTKLDHLEKNKNIPSLSLFIFPTDQELFLFVLNSKSLGPLNSQIG